MDSNRDAAERCVEFARAALDAGDADKAMRLLLKSQRLYPLDEVRCIRLIFVDISDHRHVLFRVQTDTRSV